MSVVRNITVDFIFNFVEVLLNASKGEGTVIMWADLIVILDSLIESLTVLEAEL